MKKVIFFICILFGILLLSFLGYCFWYKENVGPIFQTTNVPTNDVLSKDLFQYQKRQLSEDILWDNVEIWRINNNLKPFIKNDLLCDLASLRVDDIQTTFSHDKFFTRDKTFLKTFSKIGENLAQDYISEEILLKDWIASPEHFKNLQDSYSYSCIKIKNGRVVQIFGSKE